MIKRAVFLTIVSLVLFCQIYSQDPGTLDPSFGMEGKLFIECSGNSVVYDMQILDDGKILIAGACSNGLESSGMVAMLNPDGTVYTGFGEEGFTYLNIPDYSFTEIKKIIIDESDTIYALIETSTLTGDEFRLDPNRDVLKQGRIAKLGPNGYLNDVISVGELTANIGLRQDLEDRLLTVSNYKNTSAPDPRGKIHIRRFTSTGLPDPTFGINGFAEFADESGNDFDYVAGYLDYLTGGRMITIGNTNEGLDQEPLALVTLSDGTPDMTFGVQGYYLGNYNTSTIIQAGFILDGDTIMLAGSMFNLATNLWDQALIKLDPAGNPVTGFGVNGLATNSAFDVDLYDIEVQSDKRSIAIGAKYTLSRSARDLETHFFLSKYMPDGSLDLNFGDNGNVSTDFGYDWNIAKVVKLQMDGKIVVGGFASNGVKHTMALARYFNDVSVSVEETMEREPYVNIFPNPANNHISIDISDMKDDFCSVRLVNEVGSILYHEERAVNSSSTPHTIYTGDIATGLYTIVIEGNRSLITEKISIIR